MTCAPLKSNEFFFFPLKRVIRLLRTPVLEDGLAPAQSVAGSSTAVSGFARMNNGEHGFRTHR